jgi:hypothetical protein
MGEMTTMELLHNILDAALYLKLQDIEHQNTAVLAALFTQLQNRMAITPLLPNEKALLAELITIIQALHAQGHEKMQILQDVLIKINQQSQAAKKYHDAEMVSDIVF